MMLFFLQLQQYWQMVVDCLLMDFFVVELSLQVRLVMVFSDFVEQSVIVQLGWLNEFVDFVLVVEEWWYYEVWLQECLQVVIDEVGLM